MADSHTRTVLRQSDAELADAALDELRRTMGIASRPILVRVFRWRNAMPQYTLDHPSRLRVIDARCAGLEGMYLAGASYRGVGIPDCTNPASLRPEQAMEHMNGHEQV